MAYAEIHGLWVGGPGNGNNQEMMARLGMTHGSSGDQESASRCAGKWPMLFLDPVRHFRLFLHVRCEIHFSKHVRNVDLLVETHAKSCCSGCLQ